MILSMTMILVASLGFGFLALEDLRDQRYREILWDALGILIAIGIILFWDFMMQETLTWVIG